VSSTLAKQKSYSQLATAQNRIYLLKKYSREQLNWSRYFCNTTVLFVSTSGKGFVKEQDKKYSRVNSINQITIS